MESIPNVLLVDLPLRPSALQWWHQKGFRSTVEVQQGLKVHSNGSIIQWAHDLNAKSAGFLVRFFVYACRCFLFVVACCVTSRSLIAMIHGFSLA